MTMTMIEKICVTFVITYTLETIIIKLSDPLYATEVISEHSARRVRTQKFVLITIT